MKKIAILALLALGGTASARDSNIRWMKFDEALAKASTNGQPICVFVSVNPNGSGWSTGSCTQTERSFGQDTMVKLNSGFYMVRCADKATSDKVKSSAISTMIFFDGDGKEYHRTIVGTVDTVEAAFKKANELYAKKPISWATGEPSAVMSQSKEDKKKLVALVFVDDKKDSETLVASLEDRWVAKHQERLVYTKIAYDKTSEICKKYNVTSAPTLILVNPSEEDSKKSIVDQLVAKKELGTLHNFLVKAFEKFDKASKS